MRRFEAPDLPQQLRSISSYVEWATGYQAVWIDTKEHGNVRKTNKIWNELRLHRFALLGKEIRNFNNDNQAGDAVNPREECLNTLHSMIIQLNTKSRSQDFDSAAWYSAIQAQTKVFFPYAMSTFFTPNQLSVNTMSDVINMPQGDNVFDDRQEDIATLEFNLNAVLTATDAAAVGTYIESIELTSNWKDASGTPLPSALQLDNEVIP